jgi:hypothetical protein
MSNDAQVKAICQAIEKINLDTLSTTLWGEEIEKIVSNEDLDAETIAKVIVRLKPSGSSTLANWRALLTPLLLARIGIDQSNVLKQVSASSNRLACVALFFAIAQGSYSVLQWVQWFSQK